MAMEMWKGDDLEARMVTRKFLKSGVSCTLDFYWWMAFSSGGRLAVEVEEDGKPPVVRFVFLKIEFLLISLFSVIYLLFVCVFVVYNF